MLASLTSATNGTLDYCKRLLMRPLLFSLLLLILMRIFQVIMRLIPNICVIFLSVCAIVVLFLNITLSPSTVSARVVLIITFFVLPPTLFPITIWSCMLVSVGLMASFMSAICLPSRCIMLRSGISIPRPKNTAFTRMSKGLGSSYLENLSMVSDIPVNVMFDHRVYPLARYYRRKMNLPAGEFARTPPIYDYLCKKYPSKSPRQIVGMIKNYRDYIAKKSDFYNHSRDDI